MYYVITLSGTDTAILLGQTIKSHAALRQSQKSVSLFVFLPYQAHIDGGSLPARYAVHHRIARNYCSVVEIDISLFKLRVILTAKIMVIIVVNKSAIG